MRAFQPVKQSAKQRPSNNYEESVESDKGFPKENEFNVKQSAPLSPWRHLVRLLGLQPNQISAVAVNALIFVAQMVRFKVINTNLLILLVLSNDDLLRKKTRSCSRYIGYELPPKYFFEGELLSHCSRIQNSANEPQFKVTCGYVPT